MKNSIVAMACVMLITGGLYAESFEDKVYTTSLQVGTLGVGIDVSTPINKDVSLRFNINGLKYSSIEEVNAINYDGDLSLFSVGVLVDYYPYESNFKFTGGLYYNNNSFVGTATPTTIQTISINNVQYDLDQVQYLDTELSLNKIAPYVGIGWSSRTKEKGWGFTVDLGMMYFGEPEATMTAVYNPTVTQEVRDFIQADVDAEVKSAEDELRSFRFAPVLMIGVNYTF
jgi:hypothetical protein